MKSHFMVNSAQESVQPRVDVAVVVEAGRVEDRPAAKDRRHRLDGRQLQRRTTLRLDWSVGSTVTKYRAHTSDIILISRTNEGF